MNMKFQRALPRVAELRPPVAQFPEKCGTGTEGAGVRRMGGGAALPRTHPGPFFERLLDVLGVHRTGGAARQDRLRRQRAPRLTGSGAWRPGMRLPRWRYATAQLSGRPARRWRALVHAAQVDGRAARRIPAPAECPDARGPGADRRPGRRGRAASRRAALPEDARAGARRHERSAGGPARADRGDALPAPVRALQPPGTAGAACRSGATRSTACTPTRRFRK